MRKSRIRARSRRVAFLAILACAGLGVSVPRWASARETPPDPTRPSRGTAGSDSLRIYQLGEVIVTADRLLPEMEAGAASLSASDLERLPGRTVGEMIAGTVGVAVSTGRKDETSITIRGFDARRIAILVDGRPMNMPYYGTFDLSSIDSGGLEGIDVVRGPSDVTYGANVMGGVVNLLTPRGRDRPGTRLNLRIGSQDTGEVGFSHGWVRRGWDLFGSVRAAGSDGTVLPVGFRPIAGRGFEDGGQRDNSDVAEWNLFGKLGYTRGAELDLALSAGYHTQEKGVPGAVDEERYWRFTDWRRYFADLTLRRRLNAATQLEAKGYGDVFVNTLVDYEDAGLDPSAVFYESTHDAWDAGGIVALERDWTPGHHATYGFSLREDQIKKRMNPAEAWLFHHQVTGSVYAQHTTRLHPRWSGSLGLSDDFMVYNHLRAVDHVLGYTATLSTPLTSGWRLRASLGQSSRFPTLSQLWGSQSGNRNLRAEIARRYELAVDGRLPGGMQTASALFHNDLSDLIDRDVRRAGRYQNISAARTWGAETECTIRAAGCSELQVSYAYTGSENEESGRPLDLIPRHKVDGRLRVRTPDEDTQWVFTVTHAGSRFDSEALTADQRLPAYTRADCRVTTRATTSLAISVDVQNIGDYSYAEEVGYPAPGRSILFSVALDF